MIPWSIPPGPRMMLQVVKLLLVLIIFHHSCSSFIRTDPWPRLSTTLGPQFCWKKTKTRWFPAIQLPKIKVLSYIFQVFFSTYLGGGNSNIFEKFSPRNLGEDFHPIWLWLKRIFFRWVGWWFNHQPQKTLPPRVARSSYWNFSWKSTHLRQWNDRIYPPWN